MTMLLLDAIAETTGQLTDAARSIGGALAIDPRQILERDSATPLQMPSTISANRHCRLIEARDGWLAVNLARPDDALTVPAWIGCDLNAHPWEALVTAARDRSASDLAQQGIDLHLPVAIVGETVRRQRAPLRGASQARSGPLTAVDLSALWAGPLCGGLLADAGIEVTRIESPSRPDPVPRNSPRLDHRINGRKRRIPMALDDPDLFEMIARSDVLITSARPHALERKGLSSQMLFTANPDLIWVAITAHGWSGREALRTGFGDDCAAAGGLVTMQSRGPSFIGDALADPLTGLLAALAALHALADGNAGLIDISLAQSAARFADMLATR